MNVCFGDWAGWKPVTDGGPTSTRRLSEDETGHGGGTPASGQLTDKDFEANKHGKVIGSTDSMSSTISYVARETSKRNDVFDERVGRCEGRRLEGCKERDLEYALVDNAEGRAARANVPLRTLAEDGARLVLENRWDITHRRRENQLDRTSNVDETFRDGIETLRPSVKPSTKSCVFCGQVGNSGTCGSLVTIQIAGEETNFHHACALWAPDVYQKEVCLFERKLGKRFIRKDTKNTFS